jgi:hypothetical protein
VSVLASTCVSSFPWRARSIQKVNGFDTGWRKYAGRDLEDIVVLRRSVQDISVSVFELTTRSIWPFIAVPLEVEPQTSSREARRWRQRVVLMFDRRPGDGHRVWSLRGFLGISTASTRTRR